ncbi:hypothetical protein ACJX0J_012743, partial [Zea mays]
PLQLCISDTLFNSLNTRSAFTVFPLLLCRRPVDLRPWTTMEGPSRRRLLRRQEGVGFHLTLPHCRLLAPFCWSLCKSCNETQILQHPKREYDEENPRSITKCEHHFHICCILKWMERKDTCPVCDQ